MGKKCPRLIPLPIFARSWILTRFAYFVWGSSVKIAQKVKPKKSRDFTLQMKFVVLNYKLPMGI